MNKLTTKEKVVIRKLEENFFQEKNQDNIIKLVKSLVKRFNNDHQGVDNSYLWATTLDFELTRHLLVMFQETKSIELNKIDFDDFKFLWNQYCDSDEYYMQILNYVVNSDDYIYGDRFNQKPNNVMRPSNYLPNAIKRWEKFSETPSRKREYYSKLMASAKEINELIVKSF